MAIDLTCMENSIGNIKIVTFVIWYFDIKSNGSKNRRITNVTGKTSLDIKVIQIMNV